MFQSQGKFGLTERHCDPVVVVGLGTTGLGVVRSLSHYRIPMTAVTTLPREASTYSRLCRKIFVNSKNRKDMWETVFRVGKEHQPVRPILFLTSDLAVLEASQYRDALSERFRFKLPEQEMVNLLMDKTAFAEFAEKNGLPVPKTIVVRNGRGWIRVLEESLYPCIVKPKYRSVAWEQAGLPKVYRADTRDQLEGLVNLLSSVEGDFVVQEWIPGNDSDVFFYLTYCHEAGYPLVGFTGRKIRQWPPQIGCTSMAEPAASDEVVSVAQRLIKLSRFKGIGSVELKRDSRNGCFKIMEPTVGRPNLQSEVATANGVNIVYRAYCELSGQAPIPLRRPREKTRWIYLDFDLTSGFNYWRKGELTLMAFIRSYRFPRYYADLSWQDPLPFIFIMLRVFRNVIFRLFAMKKFATRKVNSNSR